LFGNLEYRFPIRYRVVWVALCALIVLCLISAPTTLTSASMRPVTALAGVLAIAATGQLLVMVSGGIDLSVPAVMTMAGAIVVKGSEGANDVLPLVIAVALVAGAVVGLVNGL